MNETPFIGAYWSARKEGRRECAESIASFLRLIKTEPGLDRWFLRARSRKAAVVALEITPEGIEQRLETNNRDADGNAIEELGYNLSIWNANDISPASLAITCGAFSSFIKNSAVLCLAPQPPPTDAQSCEAFRRLLRRSVQAWDPDVAVAASTEFLHRQGGGMPWETGGWVTYRRRQRNEQDSK